VKAVDADLDKIQDICYPQFKDFFIIPEFAEMKSESVFKLLE
jgi:hypothetical protein